jgi:uncharacterized membrane protein
LDEPSIAEPLYKLGKSFFAVATIAFGVFQLVRVDFVRLVPELPTWLPAHPLWAALIGVLLLVIGISILFDKHAGLAAGVLAGVLLFSVVFQHIPEIAADPARGYKWTNPAKALALFGGAILIAGAGAASVASWESIVVRAARRLLPFGPSLFFGVFFIIGGIQHFVYAEFVTQLVPAWMPRRAFWTYFTGVALMAGGVGVLIPLLARWAAALSGVMVFLWVLLLHLPRAFADFDQTGEMDGVFEALALSGVAFMLAAGSSRRETVAGGTHRPSFATSATVRDRI